MSKVKILFPEPNDPTGWVSLIDSQKLIVVGANGSGKTKLGAWFEANLENTHRISAQKSLSMPDEVQPSSLESATRDFLYGHSNGGQGSRRDHRWGSRPDIHLLNDFASLMRLLHTEEYEKSVKFKTEAKSGLTPDIPVTSLDKIKSVWEQILPTKELVYSAGKVKTKIKGTKNEYNASSMSDGERVIFYLLGEILCSPENSILIFDEPELHIHKSLLNVFWSYAEALRPNCYFIYLTHDLDFAASRQNADKVWLKEFDGAKWEYKMLPQINEDIPEELLLEMLGSRRKILFIEGKNTSYDSFLYQHVFDDYTVKSLGSCTRVINFTKAFKALGEFHHISSNGIVDRDRRSDTDVYNLNSDGIWVPAVAEIENFFLLESVVRTVAKSMMKDENLIFRTVKSNVINFFKSELNKQVSLHATHQIRKELSKGMQVSEKPQSDIEIEFKNLIGRIDIEDTFSDIQSSFQQLITNSDYLGILKVFNHKKGLIPRSNVAHLCGILPDNYIPYIKSLIQKKTLEGEIIIDEIKSNIITEPIFE